MHARNLIMTAAILLSLAACRTYYVFPVVEVETESLSPTYRLTITNDLSGQLKIVPAEGARAERIVLAPGEAAEFALVVKKLKVGGSPVPQVIESEFIEVESAGFGSIRLTTDDVECPDCLSCDLRLDVRDPGWFAERKLKQNSSPVVEVCIDSCRDGRVVFRNGPESECQS